MAKANGSTKGASMPHTSIIGRLKESKNFFINAGMNRYDDEKDDPRFDFSDMENLTDTDRTYLVAYLSNSYSVINDGLRSGEMSDEVKAMVKGIDRAVAKLNPYQGTVYRGLQFDTGSKKADIARAGAILDYYKSNVGKEITERTYISTGKVKSKVERKFSSTIVPSIHITLESKTGRDVSHYNSEEKEVLFRRGTRFRVLSVKGSKVHLQEV